MPLSATISGRFSVGRRAFLKLASAAGIVGMTGSASATASASDQSSYPITVHAFDDGPWEYTIEHDLDGRSGDLYVTALDGEWTYYISARDTISPTSVSEETETDYGSSVSGHVSAATGDDEDGYNYTETIDFIHVNDAIFFDLTFGN